MKSNNLIILLVVVLTLLSCSDSLTGGSSTVESGYTAARILDSSQTPVKGVTVTLYPEESSTTTKFTQITNAKGIVNFTDIPYGTYTLYADNDSLSRVKYPIHIENKRDTSSIILSKPGRLLIKDTKNSFNPFFKSLPFTGTYDKESNLIIFASMPTGSYPPLYYEVDLQKEKFIEEIVISEDCDFLVNSNSDELFGDWEVKKQAVPYMANVLSISKSNNTILYGTRYTGPWKNSFGTFTKFIDSSLTWFNDSILKIESVEQWSDSSELMTLIKTPLGVVWQHNKSFYKLGKDTLKEVDGQKVLDVYIDNANICYASYENGVYYFSTESGLWKKLPNQQDIISFAGSMDSELFMGTANGELITLTSSDTTNLTIINSLNDNIEIPKSMTLSSNNELYIGTETGLIKKNGITFEVVYLNSSPIQRLIAGKDGSIVNIENNNLLNHLSPTNELTPLITPPEIETIHDLTILDDGTIQVAAGKSGILIYTPTTQ